MRSFFGLLLRIFFRRIDEEGAQNVPLTGPLLLVLNHPNALVDPLFVLALAPRSVAFLAKEPLFRMPIVGTFVKRLGSIPVYRKVDGVDTALNQKTFDAVFSAFGRGEAIALFPEGTSHSDPVLRPFKTGAARMAIGGANRNGQHVAIVPAGIYYTAKGRFRSSALITYGLPIFVAPTANATSDPDPASVTALTASLESALAAITMQATNPDTISLVTRTERIFSSDDMSSTRDRNLVHQHTRRRELLAGYIELRQQFPVEVADIEAKVGLLDRELKSHKMAPENLLPAHLTVGSVIRHTAAALAAIIVMAPSAIVGIVIHFPAYQLTGPLVTRGMRVEDDVVATGKMLTAMALFPLTWITVAVVAGHFFGWPFALASLVVAPLCGYVALPFLEQMERLVGAGRGLALRLIIPQEFNRLDSQRKEIQQAIIALNGSVTGSGAR